MMFAITSRCHGNKYVIPKCAFASCVTSSSQKINSSSASIFSFSIIFFSITCSSTVEFYTFIYCGRLVAYVRFAHVADFTCLRVFNANSRTKPIAEVYGNPLASFATPNPCDRKLKNKNEKINAFSASFL